MYIYLYHISFMCPVLSFCNYFHFRAPFYKYRLYISQDQKTVVLLIFHYSDYLSRDIWRPTEITHNSLIRVFLARSRHGICLSSFVVTVHVCSCYSVCACLNFIVFIYVLSWPYHNSSVQACKRVRTCS